jgi:alkylhydroperoxidase family enzyme
MAVLLSEIQWGDPVLPVAHDVEWEAELKRRGVPAMEVDRRIAPVRWLRETAYEATTFLPVTLPERLFRIGNMVTAQENSCRYCYGANRAYLRVIGYSDSFIQQVEREAQIAELDDKERSYIAFCRSLARSRPRPAAAERAALLVIGYTQTQIGEIAFMISACCFYNRVSTLLACPPEEKFERMANGPMRWLLAVAFPIMKMLAPRKPVLAPLDSAALAAGPFGAVLVPLAGLPAGRLLKAALDGAFEPGTLSRTAKALVFAVVARTLACPHCEAEGTRLLQEEGLHQLEIETALATLRCSRLSPREAGLPAWARDTVHYTPSSIQQTTRALGAELGAHALLEAIGVAALANATVRLAMLLR